MGRAADPRGGVAERARLGGGDQLLQRLDALGRRDHGHVGDGAERDDRREIAGRIVGDVRIGRGRRGMRGGVDQDGVAVGLGLRDQGGADGAARSSAVLDHDGLAELGRERIEHDAPDDIERAAGRERDHGADRSRRPGLREGARRQRRQREPGGGEAEDLAARGHHSSSREKFRIATVIAIGAFTPVFNALPFAASRPRIGAAAVRRTGSPDAAGRDSRAASSLRIRAGTDRAAAAPAPPGRRSRRAHRAGRETSR